MTQVARTIGFFDPISFKNYNPAHLDCNEHLIEVVDSFFHLCGPIAEVTNTYEDPNKYTVHLIEESCSCWTTALKIVGYLTLILPLILLIAKAILRSTLTVDVEDLPPTPNDDRCAEICLKYGLGDADAHHIENLPPGSSDNPYTLTWREGIDYVVDQVLVSIQAGRDSHEIGTKLTRPKNNAPLSDAGNQQYTLRVMHDIPLAKKIGDKILPNMLEVVLAILEQEEMIQRFETRKDSTGNDVYTVSLHRQQRDNVEEDTEAVDYV